MSGEHVYSEGLFVGKYIVREGSPKFKSAPAIARGELKAKVLCTIHNGMLSELDSEAKKLSDALREHFQSPSPREAHAKVDGWKIELWCLKTLHNFIASKWQDDRPFSPDPSLVKIAFGEGRLRPNAGLFVVNKPAAFRPFQLDRHGCTVLHDPNNTGNLLGAYIQLQGLGFIIKPSPGDPTLSLRTSKGSIAGLDWSHAELVHRPPSIARAYLRKAWAAHERAQLTIEFAW
jgi:hypothetical protein